MPGARLAQTRHELSPKRRDEGPVRLFALGIGPGIFSPPQPAGWTQLVSTRTGAMVLRCADASITITARIAARVPEGVAYALDIRSRSELRIVMARTAPDTQRLTPVLMTPLLRETVERAVEIGYLDPANLRHAHVLAVIEDELTDLRDAPMATLLRMPTSAHVRASIERHLVIGDEPLGIASLASAAHVSMRTFERRFLAETGLRPREWLRRARLAQATIALASGSSVTEAGLAIGYASTSAFIAAYREVFHVTPGQAYRSLTWCE